MRKVIFMLLTFLSILIVGHAQDQRPVIALLRFEALGVSENETRTIENLIQSYVSEFQDLRMVSQTDRDKVLIEQEFASSLNDPEKLGNLLSANYLMTGSVGAIGDDRVLSLDVIKVSSGEKKSISEIFKSIGELALGTRKMTLRILDRDDPSQISIATKKQALSVEDILGTWKGDKGIEVVRISRGGKAIAILSSSAQMELAWKIEGAELSLQQSSQNSTKFYHPVPYKIALELTTKAKPMRWTFSLYSDGMVLKGSKISSAVSYDGDRLLEIIHGAVREAEWTRLTR